jgi:hypothetical protein
VTEHQQDTILINTAQPGWIISFLAAYVFSWLETRLSVCKAPGIITKKKQPAG